MIIDFHTHTFPDEIAEQSISYLEKKGHIKAVTNAKRSTLVRSMRESGVDVSLVLPVATRAKQEKTINSLSAELNGKDGIFYAGAIHPDCEDVEGTLNEIKAARMFAVKLHPDYQGACFDDERYINILAKAAEKGLYIITHAGMDVAFPDDVHCTPDMILNVLDRLNGLIDNRLILAHMGSYDAPDEVLQKLCGKPVMMDTAAVLDLHPEKCVEIIRSHGADKVLFATDSPWKSQREYISLLDSLPLTDAEKEAIFCKNALRILGQH